MTKLFGPLKYIIASERVWHGNFVISVAREQQLLFEEVYGRHTFLRDACTWMHLLYNACSEEIVEFDSGDGDNGTCAETTEEEAIIRQA